MENEFCATIKYHMRVLRFGFDDLQKEMAEEFSKDFRSFDRRKLIRIRDHLRFLISKIEKMTSNENLISWLDKEINEELKRVADLRFF